MFGLYRTLLALMVVALHLGGVPWIGGYAVFGFYTLSGYLMTLIMHQNYGYSVNGFLKYSVNRFLRVYPLYWVSALLSLLLIYVFGESYTSDYHRDLYYPPTITDIIKNGLIIFPDLTTARLVPAAWALTVELFFYMLIGLGLSKNKSVVIFWVVLSVIYHALALTMGYERYLSLLAASLPFSIGAFIYHYKAKLLSFLVFGKILTMRWSAWMIFILILLNWYVGYVFDCNVGIPFYINCVFCALMVVVLSQQKTLPFISKTTDQWIGDLSYPIYLVHHQVGILVGAALTLMGPNNKIPDLALMFAAIPFILIVSWLLTVILERPIERARLAIKQSSSLFHLILQRKSV